ncbi:hypothetical protein CSQ96_14025 [Janthinobacterium sp. BJB412]|nr:hypothetical protein CSQ96_14025 [Janthinobacterium sp. BJB412]
MSVQSKLAIAALTLGLAGVAAAVPMSIAAPALAVPAVQLDEPAAPYLLDALEQAELRDVAALRADLDATPGYLAPGHLAPAPGYLGPADPAPAPRRAARAGLSDQAPAPHRAEPAEQIPELEIYTMFLFGIAILLLAGRRRDAATPWGMIRVNK